MKRRKIFALCLLASIIMFGCESTSSTSLTSARIAKFQQTIKEKNMKKIAKLIKKSSPEENVDGLLVAVASKSKEAVEIFLDAGIDVNSVGSDNRTPLISACSELDNVAVVKLLLERGADTNCVNSKGQTPLMHAVSWRAVRSVFPLLTNGGYYDANVSVIKLLLQKGASVNSVDNEARTALYYAVRAGNEDAIQPLIQFGADVNVQCNGESLLFTAQKAENSTYIISLLREAGVEFTEADKLKLEQERKSSENFYNEVIYRRGTPIKTGDEFLIDSYRIQVLDRTTTQAGYTYLVTYYPNAYELGRDHAYSLMGGGAKYCFYIVSKKEMALRKTYSYTTSATYITSVNDLKITCIGMGKYQHNYQDVSCYMFSLDAEL